MTNNEYAEKLGLRDGQFFAKYRYKNLWWFLNGVKIGYGDIRDEDILRLTEVLTENDEFLGFNEHHGSDHQQRDLPMLRITKDAFQLMGDIDKEAKKNGQR